ncbi:SAM-dependent methyltransferase [Corynebacterium phocae]|uniref:SAM-dependent methyltransferase n=1 Tax=Corynebacterium phocae TaxID=161895 RepID=A0A1L7D387_9CORY|nr:class I SAM-dependent methyltransferase [Corynebacterium phocae]APT92565.1 SAM-dependent methyltransferase [Corynebacterium phocae]KAA8725165.1 class I SAM-dependent methyltransferase [Corynebacterium phocae]
MPHPYTSPPPENFPHYRRPSAKDAPSFTSHLARTDAAQAFSQGAETYQDVRPGYPDEVAALLAGFPSVVDIGAGTGKFTEALGNHTVYALDPSADMCRVLRNKGGALVWRAKAEATALPAASVHAASCAQTWHWVDSPAACAELDRIIRPGGRVVLVWNTLDVTAHPWVLRLSRIMHSGDVQKEGFYPEVGAPWEITQELRLKWEDTTTPERLHQLMHTRSYWLRAKEKTQLRMTHNLNWYLFEHLGFAQGQHITLPYRTDAFVLERAPKSP